MPLNSALRQPRLSVQVNGAPISGAMDATVQSNNHYAADQFSVSLALGADPFFDSAFWASASDVLVDLGMSLDGGLTSVSLLQGAVDQVVVDAYHGTVHLEGRDLTATLIEARTQETFSNRTSSEIAILLAQRHGLTPDVTPTSTLVGRYYDSEHDSITLDQFSRATTEWDLLVFLARQEQFDIYVQGTTLSFNPAAQLSAGPILLLPSDLIDLRMERSLTLAGGIQVTVKSWNMRQQRAFTQTASSAASQAALNANPANVRNYVYIVPNLTTDQAIQYAQRKLAELTRHQRVLSLSMQGDLSLTPRDTILLQGSNTAFDQAYYVDQIERRLSIEGGFTQHVRASNIVPNEQATPPADIVASVTG